MFERSGWLWLVRDTQCKHISTNACNFVSKNMCEPTEIRATTLQVITEIMSESKKENIFQYQKDGEQSNILRIGMRKVKIRPRKYIN